MSGKLLLLFLFVALQMASFAQGFKTKNVILLTLDGLRWQEVFSGADSAIMTSESQKGDFETLKVKYWDQDASVRRKKLMPFFWNEIASNGLLLGNRELNCKVNVTNKFWFSYPGYNELLTGVADEEIDHNDKIYNSNVTVFEAANQTGELAGKVAAFGSWDRFPYIFNNKRCGFPVNGGTQLTGGKANSREQLLNEITENMIPYTEDARYDVFTYNYAIEYLKVNHPRLFFLGFDETDDNAHKGEYKSYLAAAQQSDRMISHLWQWLQSDPQYRDQTTLIVTCDHGRGEAESDEWMNHGSTIEGSDQTWIAMIGPDTPAKGEARNEQLYNNQIAQTIALLLNFNYYAENSGKPLFHAVSNELVISKE